MLFYIYPIVPYASAFFAQFLEIGCEKVSFLLAVTGVLFVRVHKGMKLIPMDPDGLSDPYCMIFANKELVC